MSPFRGAAAGFRGVSYPLLPQIRKAPPTLMRVRAFHGPMPATARSASLRCHRSRDTRPDRFLGDDVEAVFVLVGFRRFAQFSDNQHQRADFADEKACDYEHDLNQARFAPLSIVSTLSCQFPLFRKSQDTPIDTYFSSDYESGKQENRKKKWIGSQFSPRCCIA